MSLEKDFWSHLGIEIGTFRTKCRAVSDPGEAPLPPPLLLLLHQTEARRAKTIFFDTTTPPPPPTQAFLGEVVFRPSPQTPAQPRTTFLSHT